MGSRHKSVNQIFPDESEQGERLEAILNSVNGELKTSTLLVLDDAPKSGFSMRDILYELIGTDRKLNPSVFTAYCQWSLSPRGLVHETLVNGARKDPTSAFGYTITEAGRKYGQPIAAFTLDYVVKNQISMFSILGSSNSKGRTNGPLNRAKILENLDDGKIRSTELSQAVNWGTSSNIGKNHLIPLSKIGFVKAESCGEMVGALQTYSWESGEIEKVKAISGYIVKAKNVAEKIKELGTTDNFALAKFIDLSEAEIRKILVGLEKQGFIKANGRWTNDKKSENALLEKGKNFRDNYLSKIEDCLADGPALKELTEFYDYLKNTNDGNLMNGYMQSAVNLYFMASPHMHCRTSLDVQNDIIQCLKANPDGLRYNGLSEKISLRHATFPLRALLSAGIVKKKGKNRNVRYYLNKK